MGFKSPCKNFSYLLVLIILIGSSLEVNLYMNEESLVSDFYFFSSYLVTVSVIFAILALTC